MGRRSVACLVVIASVVALCAPAAMAGGSQLGLNNDCGSSSQPFAQFGDYRNYTFGANGGLENGSTGWSLGGGQIVKGNESFYVHSFSDRYSLALSPGGNVTTGWAPHVEPRTFLADAHRLREQAAVFLLDVPRLEEEEVASLESYVREGGGVVALVPRVRQPRRRRGLRYPASIRDHS